MKLTKNNIIKIAGILSLVYMLYLGYNLYVSVSENLKTTTTQIVDYSNLFSPSFKNEMKLSYTKESPVRNPISVYNINNKYTLFIHKYNLRKNSSLSNVVKETIERVSQSSRIAYHNLPSASSELAFKPGKVEPVEQLSLFLYGDSLKTVFKNDTAYLYYLKLKNIGVKLDNEKNIDLIVQGKEVGLNTLSPSTSLLLYKKNNSVFFIVMVSKREDIYLDKNQLFEIIK